MAARHRPILLSIVVLLSVLGMSIPAGGQEQAARTAPAIGPWLGAPRGSISSVRAIDGGVTVSASVVDADSASPIRYAITVDGVSVDAGSTDRPDGFGQRVDLTRDVDAVDGFHEVCLRLGDARFSLRTVDCVLATTAPPDTVKSSVANNATGALLTTNNIVVPITGGGPGAWEALSPCGLDVTISEGTFIPRARVVVDAGHGGSESGAYGGSGFSEKTLNLDVAERIVAKFNDMGIAAQLTRTSDYRIPIQTRADIATALAPDIFISVHHNGGATRRSSQPGTEVFYATGQPESRRLAAILHEDIVDMLSGFDAAWVSTVNQGASVRLREDRADLYGIHRYSPDINSVITEPVYLSNPSESALMQRPGMADLEAQTVVDAMLRWWWTTDTGSTIGREFVDSSSSGTGGFDGCVDPRLNATNRELGRADVLITQAVGASTESNPISLLPALLLGSDPAL